MSQKWETANKLPREHPSGVNPIKGWWDVCFELKERVESYFEIFPGQLLPNLCTGGQGWSFPKKSSKHLSLPKLKDVKSKKSIFVTCHFLVLFERLHFAAFFNSMFLKNFGGMGWRGTFWFGLSGRNHTRVSWRKKLWWCLDLLYFHGY